MYPVLVLETLHKGLYFQFNLDNRSLYKGQREPDWRSVYCDLFSEHYLLYMLLDATFRGRGLALSSRAIFDGWQLKGQAELDYYFRHDNRAVLFESKDVLVNKVAKAGHDFDIYLDEVKKKFYEDEDHHPKAARQLANNVERLLRQQLPFDTDFAPAELIVYPVLVVHDRLYNQPGLNVVVNDWFQEELAKLEQQGLPVHNVRPLIIIDVDTLCSWPTTRTSAMGGWCSKTCWKSTWLTYGHQHGPASARRKTSSGRCKACIPLPCFWRITQKSAICWAFRKRCCTRFCPLSTAVPMIMRSSSLSRKLSRK